MFQCNGESNRHFSSHSNAVSLYEVFFIKLRRVFCKYEKSHESALNHLVGKVISAHNDLRNSGKQRQFLFLGECWRESQRLGAGASLSGICLALRIFNKIDEVGNVVYVGLLLYSNRS